MKCKECGQFLDPEENGYFCSDCKVILGEEFCKANPERMSVVWM